MKMQWKIGNVEIPNPLCLHRWQGLRIWHFEDFARSRVRPDLYGMVSAKAISFHNKNTEALMEIDPGEHPVSMQLFGSEPDLMAEVAKALRSVPLTFSISIWDVRFPRW